MVGMKKKDRAYYRYDLNDNLELEQFADLMVYFNYMMELRNSALAKEIDNCNKYVILRILRAVDTEIDALVKENKRLNDTIKELKGE